MRRAPIPVLIAIALLAIGGSDREDRYSSEQALQRCDLVPLELHHGVSEPYGAVQGPYDSPISGKVDAGEVECGWQVMFTENDTCPDGTLTPGPKLTVTAVVHRDGSYVITSDAPQSQNCPDPTLGVAWANGTEGYGDVAPARISNGGAPTGSVVDIEWEDWGRDTAVGHGTGYYDSGSGSAGSTTEPATVLAFDLGQCNGQLAYRQVRWFFTEQGEVIDLSGPPHYDICTPYDSSSA